jgi:AraC-like DNA-binding protein
MELVRAAALKGYFEVASAMKLDPVPLMRRAGLTRSMLVNLEQMLPARSVIQLLEESAAASGCTTFGLRMAESRELADLGMISLLVVHQPTLGDALAVISQFRNRINSTLVLRVEHFADIALLREVFAFDPPLSCRQAEDLAIAVLYGICRSVLGDSWKPICISFGYEAPPAAERAIYQRLFSCPVEFQSEFDGILVKRTDLDKPNPRSEPALALHARKLVESIVDPGERSLAEEVEQAILMLMPAGRASVSAVADSLGMNVRTLQRRLSDEGMAFGEMLDRIRVREVNRHFTHGRQRLTDVAHLLGYASLGAFSRWYSHKFHETPSNGRKRLRHQVKG